MSEKKTLLIVESGPNRGDEITVVEGAGLRVGRSSSNDVPLKDGSVSRFHCRLHLRENNELWVSDLGSSNSTYVNGEAVTEKKLVVGDVVAVGDTTIKVVSVAAPAAPAAGATPPAGAPPEEAAPVDLGLTAKAVRGGPKIRLNRQFAIAFVAVAALAVMAVCLVLVPRNRRGSGNRVPAPAGPSASQVEIRLERVEASTKNIFRYCLVIGDCKAAVEVDDLANGRHVTRIPTPIRDPDQAIVKLAGDVQAAGFFSLAPDYSGRTPDVHHLYDLTVSVGTNTHHVRVFNVVEPTQFRRAREAVEEFGFNELGLRSLLRSKEELLKMAREQMVLGRQLMDEKNIRRENLYKAIQAFAEAMIYLETTEPKPDFYADLVSNKENCERDLGQLYNDLQFQAERAIKLKEWQEAANSLRAIMAAIPDRKDQRYKDAEVRLLDVERRMERK